jgi:hypothetical protein
MFFFDVPTKVDLVETGAEASEFFLLMVDLGKKVMK